ncbi:MAG: hypothetical protein E7070_05620 [Bacteroidales bacterium]|nr:hypothetical protein [Bacteroidales bacterium]
MNNNDIDIQNEQGKILDENLIARYMKGQLNPEEVVSFEERMENDKDFCTLAITHAHLAKAMAEVGNANDRDTIDAFNVCSSAQIKEIARNATTSKIVPLKPKHNLYKWISIAASFIIVVCFGVYYYDYRQTVSLGDEFASAFVMEQGAIRGNTSDNVEKDLLTLFENVQQGKNLDATIHRLSLLWELSTMETYNDYTDYAPYIGWNLMCAYLKDNNVQDARETARQLQKRFPNINTLTF